MQGLNGGVNLLHHISKKKTVLEVPADAAYTRKDAIGALYPFSSNLMPAKDGFGRKSRNGLASGEGE